MPERNLVSILTVLRRRFVLIAGTAGAGWGLLLALAVLLAGVWLDLIVELSPVLRLCIVGGAVVLACGLFIWLAVRSVSHSSASAVARRLDDVASTGGQIVSGVELMQQRTRWRTQHIEHVADDGDNSIVGSEFEQRRVTGNRQGDGLNHLARIDVPDSNQVRTSGPARKELTIGTKGQEATPSHLQTLD